MIKDNCKLKALNGKSAGYHMQVFREIKRRLNILKV